MDSINNKTKFCTNCGKKIPANTKFCPYCGHQQNTTDTTSNMSSNSNNNQNNIKSTTNSQSPQPSDYINTQSQSSAQSDRNVNANDIENTAHNKVNNLLNMKQDTEKEEAENARKEESLDLQERTYINDRVASEAPSTAVTYLLGIFLFEFGAPQWYLHHYIGGAMALICTFILSWVFGLGIFIELIWGIIDLFLYPLFVRHAKAKIKRHAINEVIMMRR